MGLRDFFKIDNTPPGTKRRAEAAAKKKRNKGRVGGDNEAAMAADKAARAAIVKKARPMFKIDNTPPGTKRRAEAEAKKKSAAAKKSVMAKKIASRDAKETARQGKAMAKTAVSRPTPKRPSAISLQNAATPKPTRPMKPEVPPTSRVKPPMDEVTGKGGRNVGTGKDKKANVTKEQLDASGMSLRNYLNFMDKNGKRPPKAKKMMGGGMAKKYKDGGKLPMVEKNGKMVPAYAADGKGKMMGGGMAKAYMGGGMAKKYKDGGGVRGAGCAQRGVRKAKIL